jgi:hypothetical protein
MFRTKTSFSLLQATAAVSTLAIILWSLGVPTFRFAQAANVISFSDTISDSAPSVVANHTLTFVTPSGMASSSTLKIEFQSGFTGIDDLLAIDLDLVVNGSEQTLTDDAANGSSWNVTAAGQVIDITSDTSEIDSNATVTIRIGTHASHGGTGVRRITNPSIGSYFVRVNLDDEDTGETRVMIVDSVTVTATVETVFNFTVAGVNSGLDVNDHTTTGTSTSDAIAFGVLVADTLATMAQDLSVVTNAANGFVVTVQTDQQLTSSNGADIDGFANGAYNDVPIIWEGPSQILGQENTYGHWGITTTDDTMLPDLSNPFEVGLGGQNYVSASTTPVEVFRHTGSANGTENGVGTVRVGYSVEISPFQEAADEYKATLTYVATPVF